MSRLVHTGLVLVGKRRSLFRKRMTHVSLLNLQNASVTEYRVTNGTAHVVEGLLLDSRVTAIIADGKTVETLVLEGNNT